MTTQPRKPAGTPVGGQFSPVNRPEAASVLLTDDPVQSGAGVTHLSDLDRTERVQALRSEIDKAMVEMSNAEGWQKFLESRARFHSYSLHNAWLIQFQNPDATSVAGFNDWKHKHGRVVRRGEKAIWVLAPVLRKVDAEGEDGKSEKRERIVGFRTVPVFDVSQTEGPPLPEPPQVDAGKLDELVPEGMVEELTGFVESKGFTISRGDTGPAGGWTNFRTNQVVISDRATDAAAARTLAHEAAHIALDHGSQASAYHMRGGPRPTMEIEAESVAYVIGRQYGMATIGAESFGYVDSWAQGDAEKVKRTANAVVNGVQAVVNGVKAAQRKTQEAA